MNQTADVPVESEETYSLEEILDEFGGWSKRDEPVVEAAEPEEPAVPEPEIPEPEAPAEPAEPAMPEAEEPEPEEPAEPEPPEPPKPSRFQFIHLNPSAPAEKSGGTEPEPPEAEPSAPAEEKTEKKIWQYRPEPAAPQAAAPVEKPAMPDITPAETQRRPRRRERQPAPRPEKKAPKQTVKRARPEPTYPSPEEAYKEACRKTGSLLMRRRILFLLCLAAVAVTVCCHMQVAFGSFQLEERMASNILMGLLLAGALCAYDVLVGGVYRILRLRPNLDTLLAVSTVVFAADGFVHMGETARMSHSALLLVALFFAMWGRVLSNRGKRRSLKAVLSMDETPSAAVMARRAWGNRDCVFRREGDRSSYVADLEAPDVVERAMSIYAPAVICLSLVLSAVITALRQQPFLDCWAVMLAGSIPVAAGITFWRPFASLAGRLLHVGAALCGWHGARLLAGQCCVAVQDSDLFSKANVTMNGMKVFGEYNVSQVVGYTYAIIAQSGCGLEPVFHDVFVNQNGRSYVIDNFHRYEGGGIGAEIQGDVVLVGSIGFMQLMGVRMPEGTNVRQAVYCAVNNDLAAVFAIHYNPAPPVRSGLQTVLRSRGLSLLLATRDFILTPAMVRHKYKIPSDVMEYPSVEERVRLSGPNGAAGGEQAALLSRDSFLPLAEAVSGGRSLSGSVLAGLAVNLLGGLVGFVVTVILCWLGAFTAASPFNLMLFAILWTLPALLLTSIAGK